MVFTKIINKFVLRNFLFMKLENYIEDLLYRYDLVIIPEFGGVIARKKSAQYDRDSFIFLPPYKELSFNVQLQENDGLLANYISDVEGISYDEALQRIAGVVEEWRNKLEQQKRLKLEQIGIFNLEAGDKIVFSPLITRNYLTDAYGLTSFMHRPSVKHQPEVVPVNNQEENEEEPLVVQMSENRPDTGSAKIWRYAAVFLVGLGLLGAGAYFLRNQNTSPVSYQKATFVLKQDFPPVELSADDAQKKETKILKPADMPAEKKYFIISGAFRNKNNAQRKLKQLTSQGYSAEVIGKNKHGLWMVAYNGFANEDEARQQLLDIKKVQKSAWLFIKK